MKRLSCSILLVAFSILSVFSQKKQDVVVTIGNETVSAADFRAIYERNNGNITDPAERKTAGEYLELFINFKLKVLEAKAMGMDTLTSFREELAGYRAELAAPYLTDISYNDKLLEETYRRLTLEVNASHLLITFPQNASPDDTLKAWHRILEIRNEIVNGFDFNDAAVKYSEDPSASQNQGSLGWFSVFQMVTPFEDAAYSTPEGEVSMPVRTRFGYHLLKVNGQRKAMGEIKVAHIMKMFPPDMTPETRARLKESIDSIYVQAKKGVDFASLAREHSDDQRSAANGGELPYFARSRMIPEFSDPAFALEKNGDFTEPIETDFGFHIIKRIDLQPVPEFDKVKRELDDRIRRDSDRSTQSREIFLAKLKVQYGYKKNQQTVETISGKLADWFTDGMLSIPAGLDDNDVLFVLDGKDFTANDWFGYLRSVQVNGKGDPAGTIQNHYEAWEEFAILKYEDSRLESKYPEFRSLVREYHDGLLLFAVSESEIWRKAAEDTTGLVAFYKSNRDKYMWGERFRGMIVMCENPALKEEIEDKLDQEIPLEEILDMIPAGENMVSVQEGAWSKGDNPVIDYYAWDGQLPQGWDSQNGFVRGRLTGPEPKLLEEARGYHISDYQQFLEDNWIKTLRTKYPVKINKKVLKKIENG
jgi:peptidyl-prolyl cis-trans isomerase SurA